MKKCWISQRYLAAQTSQFFRKIWRRGKSLAPAGIQTPYHPSRSPLTTTTILRPLQYKPLTIHSVAHSLQVYYAHFNTNPYHPFRRPLTATNIIRPLQYKPLTIHPVAHSLRRLQYARFNTNPYHPFRSPLTTAILRPLQYKPLTIHSVAHSLRLYYARFNTNPLPSIL